MTCARHCTAQGGKLLRSFELGSWAVIMGKRDKRIRTMGDEMIDLYMSGLVISRCIFQKTMSGREEECPRTSFK